MSDLNAMTELNIGLYLFAALISLFLLIGGLIENERRRTFLNSFNYLLTADIIMLLSEAGLWYCEGKADMIPLIQLCTFLSYGSGFAVVACFSYALVFFVNTRKQTSMKFAHGTAVVCLAATFVIGISISNDYFFWFDENGIMQYTDHYIIIEVFESIIPISGLLLVLHYRKTLGWRTVAAFSSICGLPMLAKFLIPFWNTTPTYLAISLSLIVLYIQFHAELSRQLILKEKELMQQQIAVMLSQIQSHFLYNTLTSIHYLCDKDPQAAKQAIGDFSQYLRGNLDSIRHQDRIHFEKELRHVETYLKLEKMRFDEDLQIVYDIAVKDFFVPVLTIQPIVENAVKHGIGNSENGGTVIIRTRAYPDAYTIVIEDDGIGFEEGIHTPQSHVGICNVRERLSAMCAGTLTIESSPGIGTTATIRIPRKEDPI